MVPDLMGLLLEAVSLITRMGMINSGTALGRRFMQTKAKEAVERCIMIVRRMCVLYSDNMCLATMLAVYV